jgi:hypothetical protein
MTTNKYTAGNWQRAAMVVAAGLFAGVAATPASAQFRKDDGRALDANPRSGSGGQNEAARDRSGQAVTGNQIITGNVTGGRQFRGPVPYSDPGSFRGITAGSFTSDRFVRESAGTPSRYRGDVDLNRPTAFYGSGRAAPPPVGYVPTSGNTGGYVPTGDAVAQPNYELNRTYSPSLDSTFRSAELIMPATDGSNQESVMTASPLYGVRVWRAGESPNDFLAGERQNQGNANPADRFRADPNSIQRMRDELNRTGQGPEGNRADDQGTGDAQQGEGGGVRGLERSLNQSPRTGAADESTSSAGGGSVAAGQMSSTLGSGAIGSSVNTGQSIRRNLVVAPERQTPQLARLRRAYERRQGAATSDAQAARQFNNEIRAQRTPAGGAAAPAPRAGGGAGLRSGAGATPPPAPGDAALPPETPAPAPAPAPGDAPTTLPDAAAPQPQQPAVPDAPPEKIESIAEGVEAKGLRDVLKSAEDLMREQKFAAALEKYDVARQVAPNNSLITMGRANAELAASYYRRAEQSLREAVGRAPELVVAQFDLKALVGPERLQVLVRDLKEIADNDKQVARPMILLAYIAYNTGNEAQAGEYLTAAEQRAGGDDALLSAWRKNWTLPKGAAAPDLNK